MADPTFDDLIPAQQQPPAQAAPQAAAVSFDDLVPNQGATSAPAQPQQAPAGVYYSDGSQPPSAAQQQAWTRLLSGGQIDPSRPMGDPGRPYMRRPEDSSFPEGSSYIDFDGQVKRVPQAIGAMMPIAQAKAMADLQGQGKLDRSQPIGSAANPIPWDGTSKLPTTQGAYYVEPTGGVHYVGETVDQPDYDAFGNFQGTYTSRPYVPNPGMSYGQQMANVGGLADTVARTLARGVPIAGPLAKYGDAAFAATSAKFGDKSQGLATTSPVIIDGQHPAVSWGNLFDQALKAQDARDAQVDTQHPGLSAVGQGAGTALGLMAGGELLSPISGLNDWRAAKSASGEAGLLTRSLAGAGDGAAIFGPDGYLRGQGDWNDPSRTSGALKEGGFGAIGGFGAPWLFAGAEGGYNAARDLFSPRTPVGNGTIDDLVTALSAGKPSATPAPDPSTEDLAQAMRTYAAGQEGTVKPSDMSGAVARVGRAAQRSGQSVDQLLDQVSSMGPNAMLADGLGMADLAKATADRPSSGQQILEQNLNTRQMGTRDPSTGLWDRDPASMRIVNAAAEGMGIGDKTALSEAADLAEAQKAAAADKYAIAYAHDPVSRESFGTFQGPMLDQMYQRARTISQKEFVTMPDGSERIIPIPAQMPDQLDWRTLDLMKQGADDMVGEGKRAGIGANDQNATSRFRNRFRQRLDDLNDDYKPARDAFAGPAAVIDAINDGKRFMSDNPEGTAATFAALGPSEQEGFRLGAWQTLRDRLGNTDVPRNAAQVAGVLKPDQMGRLQTIFPDAGAFADFSAKLQNEDAFSNTRNTVLKGSRTSRNQAAQDDAGEDPLEVGMHLVGAAHGNHESWLSLVAKALPKPGKMSEGTANALGAILGTPGAAQNPTLRQTLQAAWQAEAAKAAARAAVQKTGTAAGAAMGRGASAGATPPP